MKAILSMDANEAKEFFLKQDSYANFDLPNYFTFEELLSKLDSELAGKRINDYYSKAPNENGDPKSLKPSYIEDVNYRLLNNKDGKYGWRPFQLIHPALYVSLVHSITEPENWRTIVARFNLLHSNERIICSSMPKESTDKRDSDTKVTILNWWNKVEQRSLELSLYYDYVIHTDITNCYGNIYTHSIAWALHGKEEAKNKRGNSLLGNLIDSKVRDMTYGQTNGIPQGSILMDFIAELVLGYGDWCLSKKLDAITEDYTIIRYRDDYRVFSNSPVVAEEIMKSLTETLIDLGMSLGAAKTIPSSDLIRSSIKPDKLFWNSQIQYQKNFQKHLLLINELSHAFPNSGSLFTAMKGFLERISDFDKDFRDTKAMIGIVVNIAFRNPRVYSAATAIISRLIRTLELEEKNTIITAVLNKFKRLPNTGHIQIWLQRIMIKSDRSLPFTEPLCLKVNDSRQLIWNSDFLTGRLALIMNETEIISENLIEVLDEVIQPKEIINVHYDYDLSGLEFIPGSEADAKFLDDVATSLQIIDDAGIDM